MKELKIWKLSLLIIFFPFGIIYLLYIFSKQNTNLKINQINNTTSIPNNNIETDYKDIDYDSIIKRNDFIKSEMLKFSKKLDDIPLSSLSIDGEKKKKRPASDIANINFSNITKSTKIDKLFPFVVIDVETTGLQCRNCDIIEVSAIKYESGFKAVSCISSLINPMTSIPQEASKINGITDYMVKESPCFYEISNSLNSYVSGCNIIGHNLMFDMKFLYVNGIDFLNPGVRYFDTLSIAQAVLKKAKTKYDKDICCYGIDYDSDYDVENHKLDTLCYHYQIYREEKHRSLSDCLATAELFNHLVKDKCDKTLSIV